MRGVAKTKLTPDMLTLAGVSPLPRRARSSWASRPGTRSSSSGSAASSSSSARSRTSSTARSRARRARARSSARSSTRRSTASARPAMLAAIGLAFMRDDNEIALVAAFAAVIGSFLVSYTRAKAEALGLRGDVGFGSRVERVVLISVGLFFAPWGWLQWPIYVLAALAWLTVGAADPVRAAAAARARRTRRPSRARPMGLVRAVRGGTIVARTTAARRRRGVARVVAARRSPSSSARPCAVLAPPAAAGSELIARNATASASRPTRRAARSSRSARRAVETAARLGARSTRGHPSQAQPQVAFKLQYGGSIGPNVCGAYKGPPLAWQVAACTAPDGDPLGAPGLAADAPELRRRAERASKPPGSSGSRTGRAACQARDLDGLVVPPLPPPLRASSPTATGGVFGFKSTRFGVPLDTYGRNIFVDTFGSATAPAGSGEQLPDPRAGGGFCYGFYPTARTRRAGGSATARR